MLKGPAPETLHMPLTFSYSAVEGADFIPVADGKVMVAGHAMLAGPIIGGPPTLPGQERKVAIKLNVHLMVAGTDENVAVARKAIEAAARQGDDPKAQLESAVRAAELVFTATVEKAREVGELKPPLSTGSCPDAGICPTAAVQLVQVHRKL